MSDITEVPEVKWPDRKYARGFLLTKEQFHVKDSWKTARFGGWILTYDPVNRFSLKKDKLFVALLGIAIDISASTDDNETICSVLYDKLSSSKNEFLDYIDTLCGRFVIFYQDEKSGGLAVTADATGMRSVFFSEIRDVVASHYGLVREVTQDNKSDLYRFYMDMKNRPWILPATFTPYENIRGLTANHEYLSSEKKSNRIWPREHLTPVSINEASEKIYDILKKEVKIITSVYPEISVSLTAGRDSRLSLSLFRPYKNQITCFTFSSDTEERRKDVGAAREIAFRAGIPFLDLDMDSVDTKSPDFEEYSKICNTNHYHSHMRRGVYLASRALNKSLHIQSNLVEIMGHRVTFDKIRDDSTYADISKREYPDSEEEIILNAFRDYYTETQLDDRKGYHLNDFLYWEYRMCHWLNAACITESDMAFETLQLMNCRKLLEYGISCSFIYRKANLFADYITDRSWPELMDIVPNTDYTVRDYRLAGESSLEMPKLSPVFSSLSGNDIYSRVGAVSCDFGFGLPVTSAGDSIEIHLAMPVSSKGGSYFIQLCILCPSKCNCSKKVEYEILVDDTVLYRTDMGSYLDMINTVDIMICTGSVCTLTVRIVSDGSESDQVCPFLHIDSVRIKKMVGVKPSSPVVCSSKSSYFTARSRITRNK